jgi:choline dehydrogenase
VVAARLSEDPGNTVVLLEAGPDYPDIATAPDDIRSGYVMGGTDHDWGYRSEPITTAAESPVAPGSDNGVVAALRGKVVGGSSAVNGTSILRARPRDFDAWTAAGNPAWSWDAVLRAFVRLEDDPMPGDWHGQGGPLHIHRFTGDEIRPVHRAFLEASSDIGHPRCDDQNRPRSLGAGPLPLNQIDSIRQSAAVTHLQTARGRANLAIRSGVTVDRIEIHDGAPTSVVLTNGERFRSQRVVLAAGSYGSPAILLRSGIGPAGALRAFGIAPVSHLPAVGQNLRDHPCFVVSVGGDANLLGALVPPVQTILSLTSDGSRDPGQMDIQIVMMVTTEQASEWFRADPGTLLFGVSLGRPRSVGRMSLASADPAVAPKIWLNFYDDPSDLERMLYGVGVVRDLLATPALKAFAGEEHFPGRSVVGAELGDLVRRATPSGAHPTGTCRMGPDPETSVVDQTGKVHGLRGLWVIDASIMPHLPSVPTNATTMMLAERCVAWMRGQDPPVM